MHVIPRLSLIPCAALYVWIGVTMSSGLAIGVFAVLILALVIFVMRGLFEEVGRVEAGVTALLSMSLVLAALPTIAASFTPGVCTDLSAVYEIAIVAFMYLGTATGALHVTKTFLPPRGRMSRPAWRKAGAMMAGLAAIAVAIWFIDNGACTPGGDHLLSVPLISLPILGLAILYGAGPSGKISRQPTSKG